MESNSALIKRPKSLTLYTALKAGYLRDENKASKMLKKYGEVTNAKTLANVIVQQRSLKPISTTVDFKQAIHQVRVL